MVPDSVARPATRLTRRDISLEEREFLRPFGYRAQREGAASFSIWIQSATLTNDATRTMEHLRAHGDRYS